MKSNIFKLILTKLHLTPGSGGCETKKVRVFGLSERKRKRESHSERVRPVQPKGQPK